jgi:predicted Zn-dependent protease
MILRTIGAVGPLRRTAPLLFLAACAVNPATGQRQFMLVSESQEIGMGQEADPQIVAAYGLVDDPELQAYVSEIGMGMARASERPNLPWSFKVVDDPIVNAFALPGGFIYVTRGILARFDSEAELAGVLGHEIGHVTARHSASQMSRQQLQQIGLGVGMIFSETIARYGQLGAAALQLINLRYSRGDESQSDELGLRYISRAGYDPDAMIGVFQMLAQAGGEGGDRLPEWQLTHPYPENREADIRALIVETGVPTTGTVDRDEYLDRVDGIVYGANPREGYFVGSRFLHPDLAFELTFPSGWTTANQRSFVAAIAPSEDAIVMLAVAEGAATPELELRDFLSQDGVSGGPIREDEAGGIESARAPFSATTDEGTFRGEIAFVRYAGTTYRLMGYAAESNWSRHAGAVASAITSFAAVTDPAVLGVEPLRLDIVTLSEAMSLTSYVQRYGSAIEVEELARLNRTSPGAVHSAGTRIKTVVGEPVG